MKTSRPYIPQLPLMWWLSRPGYVRYMLRELTCVWIGAYVITLIVGLYRLTQGAAAWEGFWQAMASPAGILFQLLALAFALYHMVTWFALAPSTMPIWRGETQVPPRWIHAAHYVLWVVVSIVIVLLVGV